jgi:transcriptional regulator with XRE-family HTH domain
MRTTFGQVLRAMREEAGLSRAALAAKAGVSDVTVSFWEKGAYVPGLASVRKLALALGVPLDAFAAGTLPPDPRYRHQEATK